MKDKPTTLRDFFKEKFKKVFILHEKQDCRYNYLVEDVTDDVIDFFLANNTELIKKIEGLSEVFMVTSGVDYEVKSDVPLVSKREVIKLINQDGVQMSGDGEYIKIGRDIYKNNDGEWELINQEK